MTTKASVEHITDGENTAGTSAAAGAMHHPEHETQDTIETDDNDVAQRDAALRNSALRPPR